MELIAFLIFVVFFFAPLVAAICALVSARRAHRALAQLRLRVDALQSPAAFVADVPPAPKPAPPPVLEPVSAPYPEPPAPAPAPTPAPFPVPDTPAPLPSPAPAERFAPARGLERALVSRWLVWLGALILGLAAVFLVKVSIEREWLTPPARCLLGVLAGVALLALGERARRAPLAFAGRLADFGAVPPALSAAGVVALYASVYAAFALYGLLPALAAFLLLALISFAAFALALVQGPFVAVLGVLGGFALPALVSTGAGSAYALFPYLAVLAVALTLVVRYRGWWPLAWLGLALSLVWPLAWLSQMWSPGDTAVLGAYLLGLLLLHLRVRVLVDGGRPLRALADLLGPSAGVVRHADAFVWSCALAVAVLIVALAHADASLGAATLLLLALSLVLGHTAFATPRLDRLAGLALAAVVALLSTLPLPAPLDAAGRALGPQGWLYDLGAGPFVPPLLVPYVAVCAGFATLFAGAGFAALWRSPRPGLWALLSVAGALQLLVVVFVRVTAFTTSLPWSVAALAVAALGARAALALVRAGERPRFAGALAAYVVGAFAAAALALAWALEDAWLSIALALLVACAADVHRRLRVPALERVAWVGAAVVLARLVLNLEVLHYAPGPVSALGWTLYGYGVPALALGWAALRFAGTGDVRLVRFLEAGALALGVLAVTFQVRVLVAGALDAPRYSLVDAACTTLAWGVMALALYRRTAQVPHPVLDWGWRVLSVGALAHLVLFHALARNPLIDAESVGALPLLNVLLLAYGLPALVALAFARLARRHSGSAHRLVAAVAGVSALALVFAQLTLEVRRAFHGPVLASGLVDGVPHVAAPASDAEWYAYSVAWLAYAALLLALGIVRGSLALRYASLALVLATTAKLFLFDMAALEGLLRVASFLGLGLSLIAIGWVYQRYVFAPARSSR